MKELKDLIESISTNIYNIRESNINIGSRDIMPVVPLQYISEELEIASKSLKKIDEETIDKAYSWFKKNDYNVNLDIFTNNISIIIGDEENNEFDTFEISNKEVLQRAKLFDEVYSEKEEEIKPYEDLDTDEIFQLAGEYSNYVMEFDYIESGSPVSIYEFYEIEYQEYLKEQQND